MKERLQLIDAPGGIQSLCLPNLCVWPNPEVFVIILLGPGLMYSCMSAALETGGVYQFVGIVGCILMLMFLLAEWTRVVKFKLRHQEELWNEAVPATTAMEVDDPLLRLLVKARLVKPTDRFRGLFEPSSSDLKEPARTERLLRLPMSMCGQHERPAGDEFAALSSSWLSAVGPGNGAFYQLARSTYQFAFATVAGINLRYRIGHPNPDVLCQALALTAMQIGFAAYCLFTSSPGDRVEALHTGIECLLSSIAVLLQYLATELNSAPLLEFAAIFNVLSALPTFILLVHDAFTLPMLAIIFQKEQRRQLVASATSAMVSTAEKVDRAIPVRRLALFVFNLVFPIIRPVIRLLLPPLKLILGLIAWALCLRRLGRLLSYILPVRRFRKAVKRVKKEVKKKVKQAKKKKPKIPRHLRKQPSGKLPHSSAPITSASVEEEVPKSLSPGGSFKTVAFRDEEAANGVPRSAVERLQADMPIMLTSSGLAGAVGGHAHKQSPHAKDGSPRSLRPPNRLKPLDLKAGRASPEVPLVRSKSSLRYGKIGRRVRVSNMVATFTVEEEKAATKLQAVFRSKEARAFAQQLKQERLEIQALTELQLDAVLMLQCRVRGFLARRPEAIELARLHRIVTKCKHLWLVRTGRRAPKPPKVKAPSPDTSDDEDNRIEEVEDSAPAETPADTCCEIDVEAPAPAEHSPLHPSPSPERPCPVVVVDAAEPTAASGRDAHTAHGDSLRRESHEAPRFKAFDGIRARGDHRIAWLEEGGAGDGDYDTEEDDDDVFFAHFGE